MKVFIFDSSGEAYNACMVGGDHRGNPITHGDVVIIPSEYVVGVCDAWPIAVTMAKGKLHTILENALYVPGFDSLNNALDNAREVANKLGWPVRGPETIA